MISFFSLLNWFCRNGSKSGRSRIPCTEKHQTSWGENVYRPNWYIWMYGSWRLIFIYLICRQLNRLSSDHSQRLDPLVVHQMSIYWITMLFWTCFYVCIGLNNTDLKCISPKGEGVKPTYYSAKFFENRRKWSKFDREMCTHPKFVDPPLLKIDYLHLSFDTFFSIFLV